MTVPTSISQRPFGQLCYGCVDRFCLANTVSACLPFRPTGRPSDPYPSTRAEFIIGTHPTNQPPLVARPDGLAEAA